MELCNLVRSLADHLSQLDQEETKLVEGRGSSTHDVQRQLSSHLVDQFWCCVLRRSPHCSLPQQFRNKNSRYSASRILEDLDLGVRKRVTRGQSHVGVASECALLSSADDSFPSKKLYQQRDVYVDVALRLHDQAMRQKGLHLESLAFTVLLQLYRHISHIPRIDGLGQYVNPSEDRWSPFTCCDAVLEMLCHLSSEPLPCVASLELGRHALLRKGIKEVKHIDTKVMLDNLGASNLSADDALKWVSGQRTHGFHQTLTSRQSSERWTSGAFDRILGNIPNVVPLKGVTESTDLGLEKLTISPSSARDDGRSSIHSAWLPVRSNSHMEMFRDDMVMTTSRMDRVKDAEEGLNTKAVSNWLSSSLLPYSITQLGKETTTPETEASTAKTSLESPQLLVHDFRPFDEVSGHVQSDINKVNLFCHVDPKSTARVQHYNKWQILPSFDNAYLQGDIPSSPGIQISQESIIEAMVDCTIKSLSNHCPNDTSSDYENSVDWFTPVMLCLQGFESDLFESEALCRYREDPSFLPESLRKWINDDIEYHHHSIKSLCNAVLDDFLTSTFDPQNPVHVINLTPDGKFVKINLAVSPSQNGSLRMFTDLEPTELLKSLRGYNSLRIYFSEISYVGSVMRRLKCFVALIKHLGAIPTYRDIIGSTLSVYAAAVNDFIYEFENDVTNFVETDFKGNINETISIYSLFLRCIQRWLKAISWFDDVTLTQEYNEEGCDSFMLPRASFFLDYILGKYAGAFSFCGAPDMHGNGVAYRCVISTLKPYLSFLSQWLTGCRGNSIASCEFHCDNGLSVLSWLQQFEPIITTSREFCVFLERHYPNHMPPPNSMYSRYLLNAESSNAVVNVLGENQNDGEVKSFGELLQDISLDLCSNHTWLNRKMIELLRREYHISDVMDDIYHFVLLSRADLMGDILADWSLGRSNDSYIRLFRSSPVVVVEEACITSQTPFKRHIVELRFSSDLFNSYMFTEETVDCYNAIFQQLCTVHFGLHNVLKAYRWLCRNFRYLDGITNRKCRDILSLLSVMIRDMYAVLSSVQWYMHYIVIVPLYKDFTWRLNNCHAFSELLSHHLTFVRTVRRMCLCSEESGRSGVLLNSLCYCTYILDDVFKGLGFDIIREREHVDAVLSLEPTLLELGTRFSRLKREFLFIISLSREAGQSQLATIFSTTTN